MIRANFSRFVAMSLACVVLMGTSVPASAQVAPPKTKGKAAAKILIDLNKATAD
jgi:Rieske Fe-S protein